MALYNLVIAAYGGDRRASCRNYEADRAFYLKTLLARLETLRPSADVIHIVAPPEQYNRVDFNEYFESLKPGGKNRREFLLTADGYFDGVLPCRRSTNNGISYGGFSEIFGSRRTDDSYWLFMEDDYLPMQDNFDQILIEEYASHGGDCVITPMVRPEGGMPRHAAVGILFTHSSVLNKVWDKFGELPHDRAHRSYGECSQLEFSYGFRAVGCEIYDTMDKYQFSMNTHLRGLAHHGDQSLPELFAPTQKVKGY